MWGGHSGIIGMDVRVTPAGDGTDRDSRSSGTRPAALPRQTNLRRFVSAQSRRPGADLHAARRPAPGFGGARRVGLPEIAQRYESVDGTRRYLLRLDDGRTVETVLMPEGERDTVCISSQVGCPVDCKFCMTALMGLERNLTAGEIVGQVLLVARDNGLLEDGSRLNIVMMGQGEPLLNLPNVLKATRMLHGPGRLRASRRGASRFPLPASFRKIEELGREPVRPKLAISLNASTEEMRQELMPITRKYHLKDLLAACQPIRCGRGRS